MTSHLNMLKCHCKLLKQIQRKEGKEMNQEKIEVTKKEELEDLLMKFVERATKEKATTAELEVLPDVARVLANLLLSF